MDNQIKASRHGHWVVFAKKPFGSSQSVLDYLGRYTHRVALSFVSALFADHRSER